jgi:hypothetical protein
MMAIIMISMQRNILNLAVFQVFWFSCVLGGNFVAVTSLLCYGLLYSRLVGNPLKQWRVLLAILLCGGAVDTMMSYANIITFSVAGSVPVWLGCLWLGFASLFFHGLQWLRKFTLPMIASLGAILGPVTYWAGALLSGNILPAGLTLFFISYAIAWALLLPLFVHFPRLIYSKEKII